MKARCNSPSLLLGTRNPGKVREIETILGSIPWRLRSLREFESVEVAAEPAETYAENAILKAQFYARATGLCALADDSGLEVEALGGAPGVFSARYAGAGASDADRRKLLLSELAQVPAELRNGAELRNAAASRNAAESRNSAESRKAAKLRNARFVCVVAIAMPDGTVLNVSEGTCNGTITFEPQGERGFGYDPLFVPDGFNETFAELPDSIKNQISHRTRALFKTKEFLVQE
jgi:XTP/dITP diphosphohydrolase